MPKEIEVIEIEVWPGKAAEILRMVRRVSKRGRQFAVRIGAGQDAITLRVRPEDCVDSVGN